MGLEPDFLSLVNDTLTIEPCTGQTVDGAPTYGASTSAPVCVQQARKVVFFADGKTEISTTQLFVMSTSVHIGMADRLSWAGMLPGSTEPPRILAIDHVNDEDGQHHVEVSCG